MIGYFGSTHLLTCCLKWVTQTSEVKSGRAVFVPSPKMGYNSIASPRPPSDVHLHLSWTQMIFVHGFLSGNKLRTLFFFFHIWASARHTFTPNKQTLQTSFVSNSILCYLSWSSVCKTYGVKEMCGKRTNTSRGHEWGAHKNTQLIATCSPYSFSLTPSHQLWRCLWHTTKGGIISPDVSEMQTSC